MKGIGVVMLNNTKITLIVSVDKDRVVSIENIEFNKILEEITNILDDAVTKIEITKQSI